MRRSQIVSLLLVLLVAGASLAGVLSAGWTPVLGVQLQGGVEVVLRPADEVSDEQFNQAIEIIRNRVDAIGVAEPDITRQGNQVVIQLPGVKDKQRAVDLIGQTAELTFRPVISYFDPNDPYQLAAVRDVIGEGSEIADVEGGTETSEPSTVEPNVSLDEVLTPPERDEASASVVLLGSTGQTGFVLAPAQLTGEVIEEAVATFQNEWIVNVSFNDQGAVLFDQMAAANFGKEVAIVLDGVVESAPTINATEFDGQAVISGAFDGATLWSIIAWLGESQGLALTLAGATGIIVSIGVQVDSNIVYYERIKEEVRRGRAVRSAADGSFKAAFATIVWADLASLIGAGVLYQLTTGTVRGFALYLGITTLIDLAVSFFFMRPLVVFIARRLVKEKPSRLGLSTTSEGATL